MVMGQNMKFRTIDEYISFFPPKVKVLLKDLRKTIKQVAPEAEEVISYNMPALKYYGLLLYFAAHKEHIGFYPGNANVINVFKEDLISYKTSKGTIQFPVTKSIPHRLVNKIVKYRVNQNLERARLKAKKKR